MKKATKKKAVRGKAKTTATKAQAQALGELQVRHIRLIQIQASVIIGEEGLPTVAEVEATAAFKLDTPQELVRVLVKTDVEGRPAAKSDGRSKLVIKLAHEVVYHCTEGYDEALLKGAGESIANHAALIVWPYARELVQSTSSRMEMPPIILPIHHFGSLSNRQSDPVD